MKFLTILSLLFTASTISLYSTRSLAASECAKLFVLDDAKDNEKAAALFKMGQQKIDLIRQIGSFLNNPIEKSSRWQFTYLTSGKSILNQDLNLKVENLTFRLTSLSTPQLQEAAVDAVHDTSMLSLNPLRDDGRLGISIESANNRHLFYLTLDEGTQVVSVDASSDKLEAVISKSYKADNGKNVTLFEKLVIDRSRMPIAITITNWSNEFFSMKHSKTMYTPSLNWTSQPTVDSQY